MRNVEPKIMLTGPLDEGRMYEHIFNHMTSAHQWQPCCQHHVIFIQPQAGIWLDHAAMKSVVEYLEANHKHQPVLPKVKELFAGIRPEPKPTPRAEPEVVRAMSAEVAEFVEAEPKWKVKLKVKAKAGYTNEYEYLLEEPDDVGTLVYRHTKDIEVKKIKIKLEPLK